MEEHDCRVNESNQGIGVNGIKRLQYLLSGALFLHVGLDGGLILVNLAEQRDGKSVAALAEQRHAPEGGVGEIAEVPAADAGGAAATATLGQLRDEVGSGDLEDAASHASRAGATIYGFGDASQHHR